MQVDGVDFGDAIGDFGDASQPKGPSRREHFLNKHVHVRDGPAELDGDGCAGENAAAVDVRVQRLPADCVVLEQVDEAGIAEDNGAHKLEMQLQAVTGGGNFSHASNGLAELTVVGVADSILDSLQADRGPVLDAAGEIVEDLVCD